MPTIPRRTLSAVLVSLFLLPSATWGQNKLDAVAPFLDEHTLAVGHVDLTKLDVSAMVKTVGELAPQDDKDFARRLQSMESEASGALRDARRVGIENIYAVVSLADGPKEPFFLVVPVAAGKEIQHADQLLAGMLRPNQVKEVIRNRVVIGAAPVLQRLKALQPVGRPELAKAFERTGDCAAELVFAPTEDTRRVLREMLPRLPDEVGGGSGKMLVDGVQWAVLTVNPPPQLALEVTVQSKDADAAAALRGMLVSLLQLAGKQDAIKHEFPHFDDLSTLLTPRLNGDQLSLTLNDENGGAEQMLKFLTRPVQAARTAAGRAQSANNLRQLGLALHNYHDVHGHFPPATIRSKDFTKPLLSWRVDVLPYLEQRPLSEQFKLDEPWDSEHNLKLAATMPAVFASPSLTEEMRAKGLTTYTAPIFHHLKTPEATTVFADPSGTKFSKITDGTSNTIALVEVHPKHAVPWTKPEDLVIDSKAKDPLEALRGQPNDGFNALLCDGSVRFIKTDIDPQTFIWLLLMNDGNPVNLP